MGKEVTLLVAAGIAVFGFMYLSKEFCKGEEGANGGMTGPSGSLCYSGSSIQEMLGGIGGGDAEAAPGPEEASGSDEPPTDPGGSPQDIARMEIGKRKIIASGHTQDRLASGDPSPITPAESSWAHAYYTNNRITVA